MSILLKFNLTTFKVVYIDYALKLVGQFTIFSFLIKEVSSEIFGDYAYNLLVFGYISSIINSSFDALINKDLTDTCLDSEEHYFNYLKLKIILYILFSIIAVTALSLSVSESLFFWALGLAGVFNEHLDLKMRFVDNYRPVFFRILIYPIFFIIKSILALNGFIIETVALSLVECLVAILINLKIREMTLFFGGEYLFIKKNYKRFLQTGFSGFLIFTFLSLDQFFTYRFLGKDIYAGYAVLYRFYNIVNAMINIYSRYLIPKLYLNKVEYKFVLTRLFLANILIFIPIYICLYLYISYWATEYNEITIAFPIMILAGFGLIFGQVRGVYFVKLSKLVPDIYNAAIGILAFILAFIFIQPSNVLEVSICYAIGTIISGFVTTFIYRDGYNYLKKLY